MPRPPAAMLAFGLGAAAAISLAACGGEDAKLLPGQTAREITANLDTVKQLSDEGDCVGAESAVAQVGEQIAELGGVDHGLKQALRAGAERLSEVIAECEEASTEALAPAEVAPATEGEEEKASKAEGKERREEAGEEKGAPRDEGEAPPEPPQGNGKGLENGNGPPAAGGEEGGEVSPSGGLSSGAPATGEGG